MVVSAFEAGEVDTNYETVADYVDDPRRRSALVTSEVVTAATIVARINVNNKPYDDQKVRNALQMAVDNAVVLQLGYGSAGDAGGKPPCGADPSGICGAAEEGPRSGEAPRS